MDPFTVRLLGEVRPNGDERNGYPVRSEYKQRKKNKFFPKVPSETEAVEAEMTVDAAKVRLDEIEGEMNAANSELKMKQKELGAELRNRTAARQSLKEKKDGAYKNLQDARQRIRDVRRMVLPSQESRRRLKHERYVLNQLVKTAAPKKKVEDEEKAPLRYTKPTWSRPTVEDKAQYFDISQLQEDAKEGNRVLVFSGTDYGVRKMGATVAVSQSEMFTHLNRYQALAGKLSMRHEWLPDSVVG